MSDSTKSPLHEQIIDYIEGRLSETQRDALLARATKEPAVAAEFAYWQSVIGLMRSDASEQAPTHVVNRALRLMRPVVAAPKPSLLSRIVAALRFDSFSQPLAAGARSDDRPRDMFYNAEDRDIDLQIVPRGLLWQVRGQVLGPDETGTAVLINDLNTYQAQMNHMGEFTLPPVAKGRYTLLLQQGDREIEISDLELGTAK
jgi:hypothetical protein